MVLLCFRRTKKKDIYVIYTPKRPVPLEHYLYAGRDVHKIVNAGGEFMSQGFVPDADFEPRYSNVSQV
jgi:superfamily II RNA helicase